MRKVIKIKRHFPVVINNSYNLPAIGRSTKYVREECKSPSSTPENQYKNKIAFYGMSMMLAISETLPFIEKYKSNGLFDAFTKFVNNFQ